MTIALQWRGEAGKGTIQLEQLVADSVASRIFAHDDSLWGEAAQPEASIRLGWTDVFDTARDLIPRISALRDELASDGVDRIVLCGMGGSSLAPAVITRWAGVDLTMLDSTHPHTVGAALRGDLERTAVVVSSKSGSTIETRSHLAAFDEAFRSAGIAPETRIIIVTDPGSPLEADSLAAGRRVFTADPNVGGRFSALTAFGLVPSGLAGADVAALVAEAAEALPQLQADTTENSALRLASLLAGGLPEQFILAVTESDDGTGLGHWIEQLVAESTGKEGVGILPIALPSDAREFSVPPRNTLRATVTGVTAHDAASPAATESDLTVSGPLGAQILMWELATAALGRLMGIDPFNQPDVEAAKVAARTALAEQDSATRDDAIVSVGEMRVSAAPEAVDAHTAAELARAIREHVEADGYLAIQAYLDPHGPAFDALTDLRERLASKLGVPVALGFGPSYLHSVGQFHKGGPLVGAFLQFTDAPRDDIEIPGEGASFGTLIAAQARGDRTVLEERGRPVFTVAIAPDDATAVAALTTAVEAL